MSTDDTRDRLIALEVEVKHPTELGGDAHGPGRKAAGLAQPGQGRKVGPWVGIAALSGFLSGKAGAALLSFFAGR